MSESYHIHHVAPRQRSSYCPAVVAEAGRHMLDCDCLAERRGCRLGHKDCRSHSPGSGCCTDE